MDTDEHDGPDDRDYQIGYGKPPRGTQFKPGQSGNPRGRPKGTRGLKTDLERELGAPHTIQVNGQSVRGSRQQLTVMTLCARAASGELRAHALLIPLILQVFGIEDRGAEKQPLSPRDQALLNELLSDVPGEVAPEPGSPEIDPEESDDA